MRKRLRCCGFTLFPRDRCIFSFLNKQLYAVLQKCSNGPELTRSDCLVNSVHFFFFFFFFNSEHFWNIGLFKDHKIWSDLFLQRKQSRLINKTCLTSAFNIPSRIAVISKVTLAIWTFIASNKAVPWVGWAWITRLSVTNEVFVWGVRAYCDR